MSRVKGKDVKLRLDRRAVPKQERARRTMELLLDTTALLLEEVGVDGFNTNLLAERAGIGIRAIYRYFPNKHAVIAALGEREYAAMRISFEAGMDRMADPANDWREALRTGVDDYIETTCRRPGHVAMRRAMQSIPELARVDRLENDLIVRFWVAAVRKRGIDLPRASLEMIGHTWQQCSVVLTDRALAGDAAHRRRQLKELHTLLTSYLANYLD